MIGILREIRDGCKRSTIKAQDVWNKLGTLYNLKEFEELVCQKAF